MKLGAFRLHGLLQAWVGSSVLALCLPVMAQPVGAVQAPAATATAAPVAAQERSIADWLMRMHQATSKRAFIGTFVVSSANAMSSARIWHICDGEQQMERVEALTGAPRTTLRRNDEVITFRPDTKTAVAEKREALGLFPNLLRSPDSSIAQFYDAKHLGSERVAGLDADVVHLAARDGLRYGYRVWSEKKTGLVVKLQTLDTDGQVLEQAAYSELQLDAPVSMAKLTKMMGNLEGYRVARPEMMRTTALAEGWTLKTPFAGFKPMSCYKRSVAANEASSAQSAMQWIFSDGLATVSLFAEKYERNRHTQEGSAILGATRSITKRLTEKSADKSTDWWLTVVGEVPGPTLTGFANALERRK